MTDPSAGAPISDPKTAKAQAKAAKAHAKALRPWYKKKRVIIPLVIVVIGIISAVAGGGSDSGSDSASSGGGTESPSGISKGIGSQDAAADVVNLDCGAVDALGFRTPKITVQNNSSKPSDYYIEIVAESADGSQRFDFTNLTISSLGAGQTMTQDAVPFTNEIPDGSVCKVSELQRTAA